MNDAEKVLAVLSGRYEWECDGVSCYAQRSVDGDVWYGFFKARSLFIDQTAGYTLDEVVYDVTRFILGRAP